MKRRSFLKSTALAGAAITTLGSSVLTQTVSAADASAFEAKSVDDVMKLLGIEKTEESSDIEIKAPEIAENGAVVPVSVKTSIDGATNIAMLVSTNGTPLAAAFNIGEGANAEVKTRVKMGKTSDFIALVTAGDKTYMAKQEVKVTVGGCGG